MVQIFYLHAAHDRIAVVLAFFEHIVRCSAEEPRDAKKPNVAAAQSCHDGRIDRVVHVLKLLEHVLEAGTVALVAASKHSAVRARARPDSQPAKKDGQQQSLGRAATCRHVRDARRHHEQRVAEEQRS